jgi:ketosteroid isomerase-like protein
VSESNIEIVRRLYEAMNARDVERGAALMHPDAEWVPSGRTGSAPVRGVDAVIEFFTDRAEMFDRMEATVERLWDRDDEVLAFVRLAARGETSGAAVEIRIAHLWTLDDGLVVRGEAYANRDQALAATGFRE